MNHLTETQCNEYLDDVLDAGARHQMELHFASCPKCRGKLDELAAVFAALDSIPEQVLERDLVPGVLQHLPQSRERFPWRLVLAAQAAAAVALLAWLDSSLVEDSTTWLREIGVTFALSRLSRPLTEAWLSVRAWQASLPRLDAPSFQPDATLWAALILAGLAFIVGNALLLRANGREARE